MNEEMKSPLDGDMLDAAEDIAQPLDGDFPNPSAPGEELVQQPDAGEVGTPHEASPAPEGAEEGGEAPPAGEASAAPEAGAMAAADDSLVGEDAREGMEVPAAPKAAQPLPSVPSLPEDGEERQKAATLYWKQILTGNPDTVPEEVRKRAGADDPRLSAEQRNYLLYSAVNRSWAVDYLGHSRDEVAAGWPAVRAKLAEQLGVANDEQEVFLGLSHRVADAPRREAARRIYEKAWRSGLRGEEEYDTDGLEAGLLPEDGEAVASLAQSAYREGQAFQSRYGGMVNTLVSGLDAFAAMEEDSLSAPRVLASFPDLVEAVDTLPLLPEEERRAVLSLAAEAYRRKRQEEKGAAGKEEEGMLARSVRAVRRNALGMGYNVFQLLSHAHIATLNSMSGLFDGSMGDAVEGAARDWDERMRTLDELRHLVTDELAPLEPPGASKAEEYLICAAEAVPVALLSFCGGAGLGALTVAGMGEAIAEARRRSPSTPQELQYLAGVVGGAIQASIYSGLGRVGGKVLERALSDFMAARGAGLARYSLSGLRVLEGLTAQGVSMLFANKLSQAAGLGTQELASRLSETASRIDWKQFGDNMLDIEMNMREAAAMLPFLLIGSGRLALRHFRSSRAILGDGKGLLEWGIGEQQIKGLMTERNIDRQGSMLAELLQNSTRWGAPGFSEQAAKAMRLLNVEYFDGFKDKETVRDFLKLPSETTMIEKPDLGTKGMTIHKLAHMPGHGPTRFHISIDTERKRAALRLWDEWWCNSHYAASRGRAIQLNKKNLRTSRRLRIESYLRINKAPFDVVPQRMRRSGAYAPHAEGERRALLRDRVQEAKDLSYQFVMQLYALDAMAMSDIPLSRYRKYADISRQTALGEVAKCVLRTVMEPMPRLKSLDALESFFRDAYASTSYHKGIPKTLEKQPLTLPDFPSAGDPMEFRSVYGNYEPEPLEAYRITTGMRACANTLIDLLPLMDDFQTALSRGMTPAQAYHHLLVRELDFNPDLVSDYPIQQLEAQKNVTPLMNTKRNFDLCRLYTQMTGNGFESSPGEGGRTYWRLKRPNGSYSRWHETCDQAANDVASNTALDFMVFGDGANVRWQRSGAKGTFDISELPLADESEFSGYDQLCSRALNDLSRFWYGNGSQIQSGMFFKTPHGSRFRGMRGKDGITPWVREKGNSGQDLYFDRYTVATPLALIHSRFRSWWGRALDSGLIDARQGLDFLQHEGRLDEGESRQLLQTPLEVPHRGRPRRSNGDSVPDWEKINDEVAEELTRYTTLYFVTNLGHLPIPVSVKTWFGTSAFCPPPPKAVGYTPGDGLLVVEVKKNRTGLVKWGNRQTVIRLHEMAPEVEALRGKYPDGKLGDPFFQRLFHLAMGIDEGQNYEQGWCQHIGGPGAIQGTSQAHWNLLQMPRYSWARMPAEEKEDMRQYLKEFCEHEPAPGALDAIARGDAPDYVQAAIDNLDEVLQEFPELHGYAPVADDLQRVRVLLPDELMPNMKPEETPLQSPQPFHGPESEALERGSVFRAYALPDYMKDNTRASHALLFLELLRHYAIGRPYTLDNGIWWKNAFYGGLEGRHPWGLMNWQPSLPLMPLRNMLSQLHDMKQANGKPLRICGNYVEGLPPELLSPRELDLATVYRSPENRGLLYRLMPGEPNSANYRARTPYVVGCRSGVYLMERRTAKEKEHFPYIITPLQEFRPAVWRTYADKRAKVWKENNIRHTLDHVLWRANRIRALRDPSSGVVNMAELMMRLFEDTGFSQSLMNAKPENLTNSQGWLLRLAADMFVCLHQRQDRYYPETREAYNRLSLTAQALRKSEDICQLVINTLMESNESVSRDSSLYSRISEELSKQFDLLDKEAELPKEGDAVQESAQPETSSSLAEPPASTLAPGNDA